MSFLSGVGTFLKANPSVVSTGLQVGGGIASQAISKNMPSSSGSGQSLDLFSKIFGSINIKAEDKQLNSINETVKYGILGFLGLGAIALVFYLIKKRKL